MKCEICKVNQASRSIKRNVDGAARELFVCDSCARTSPHAGSGPMSLTDVLFSLGMQMGAGQDVEDNVCPACGTSRNQVRERHRLGCPRCYDVFETDIRTFISGQPTPTTRRDTPVAAPGEEGDLEKLKRQLAKAIEEERAAAQNLSGQEQVAALEKVKAKYGELTGAVTETTKVWDSTTRTYVDGSKTVITAEEAIKAAMQNVASVQDEIIAANAKLVAAKEEEKAKTEEAAAKMQAAMTSAKTAMTEYESIIVKIAGELDKLSREIAIKVDDKASGPLTEIKQKLDAIQDKTVTVTIKQTETTAAAPAATTASSYGYVSEEANLGGISWESFGSTPTVPAATETYTPPAANYEIVESYAKGLPYVPRDNFPARLHEGEAVLTREQADKWRSNASQTINFNPSISIAADHRSAEEIARQIVKPLQNEMRRLKAIAA